MATISKSQALGEIERHAAITNGVSQGDLGPSYPIDSTFILFPKLPAELRVKIWQYVAKFPRVVEIHLLPDTAARWGTPGKSHLYSTTPPPAMLRVCHESRFEGLKCYKLSFGGPQQQSEIYFNPSADTLFLSGRKLPFRREYDFWEVAWSLEGWHVPSIAVRQICWNTTLNIGYWYDFIDAARITHVTFVDTIHTVPSTGHDELLFFEGDHGEDGKLGKFGIPDNTTFVAPDSENTQRLPAPWAVSLEYQQLPDLYPPQHWSEVLRGLEPSIRKVSLLERKTSSGRDSRVKEDKL